VSTTYQFEYDSSLISVVDLNVEVDSRSIWTIVQRCNQVFCQGTHQRKEQPLWVVGKDPRKLEGVDGEFKSRWTKG